MNPVIDSPSTAPRRGLRQRGISLVTTLVMMLSVMVLGLSAILVSKGEFVLSGNLQFESAALTDAETGAIAAEQWLVTNAATPYVLNAGFTAYSSATAYMYPVGYMATNSIDPLTMTWSNSNSLLVTGTTQRYLIELIAKDKTLIPTSANIGGRAVTGCNKVDVFRIVARGSSARGASRFVQSVYTMLSC